MGTETMKGSNYAWAIAVACVAFYAIPLGVVANQAGLFASPVMEEFGWSRTDATLYMSIQPWVAAICTPFAGKLISRFNPRWVMTAAAAVFGLASLACAWFTEPWQWNVIDAAADEGATAAQARKNPALWLLIIMAGFFVIAAGMMQQFSSYASTGALGAAVGAMGVTVCMIGQLFGKFGLGWLCDHTGARVSGVVASIFGAAGIAIVLFSVDNAMMFYVGVFLFGIGFAALNIVPPMACRQAFGQKDYANIFSMVATGLNVFSGFSALIYAQIFDITGSFAGCFYLIIGFYVVTLICSLVIVPMGRRSWAKK